MTLATRPFGNLFNFSRNSTKWEMGPNGKFIEYPAGEPAYRHDPVTGDKLGISFNESVTTLQSNSLQDYNSGTLSSTEVISLFEGKVAQRVTNISETSSAGRGYGVGPLPPSGATCDLYVEITSTSRIMFGFRDQELSAWEAGFAFEPVSETMARATGSTTVDVGFRKLLEAGPNGGPVYHLWMTLLEQTTPGNDLAVYHYPAYNSSAFEDPRESIIHYVGVTDYPWPQFSPIWVDGTNLTRSSDYCHVDPLVSVKEYPRTVYVESVADSPSIGAGDLASGVVGFVRSGGVASDRAWIAYRGENATGPRMQVVSPGPSSNQLGDMEVANGELLKACLGWNNEMVAFCTNGAYYSQSTEAGVPSQNRQRLQVGHIITSSRRMNGLIKKIRVVNELWSQERMEQETAA